VKEKTKTVTKIIAKDKPGVLNIFFGNIKGFIPIIYALLWRGSIKSHKVAG
jgi:hypothetical protein